MRFVREGIVVVVVVVVCTSVHCSLNRPTPVGRCPTCNASGNRSHLHISDSQLTFSLQTSPPSSFCRMLGPFHSGKFLSKVAVESQCS